LELLVKSVKAGYVHDRVSYLVAVLRNCRIYMGVANKKNTPWQYLSVNLLDNTLLRILKCNKKYINLNAK
jgi:hypothetical protein